MTEKSEGQDAPDARTLDLIARALHGLRFGEVTIIVQDGVVVQSESAPNERG